MGKLLLACDDYIYCCDNKFYAASQEKYDFYQRYLRVFDRLKLVTRCIKEDKLKQGRILLNDKIEYLPLPIFHGPKQYISKYFEIGNLLTDVTKGCCAAVLRLPSTVAMRVGKQVVKNKLPYVTEIVYDAYDGVQSSKGIYKLLWKKIDKDMRDMCYTANGVSCVTEHYLQRRYYTKLSNGFSSHYSSLALDKSFYSEPRKYPTNKQIVIGHVANQVEYNGRKGHNEVIEAISRLKSEGIYIKVSFAGKSYNNGVEKLKKMIKSLNVEDLIDFVGFLTREELDKFLMKTDLFVLPTKAEGLPRVVIEAMAKGLPCISTNVSGNPELLNSRFLIDYSDVDSLVYKIRELVKDERLYEMTSIENYNNSLKYEASLLQKRRDEFYNKLKMCSVIQ